jgi:hypothetical protein
MTHPIDASIIGHEYLDDPDLRNHLLYVDGVCKSNAVVRGIAIHLLDRLEYYKSTEDERMQRHMAKMVAHAKTLEP